MSTKRKRRILAIDDESSMTEWLRVLLEHAGYEVKTALFGARGEELFRSWRPDLVVTDMMLPDAHVTVSFEWSPGRRDPAWYRTRQRAEAVAAPGAGSSLAPPPSGRTIGPTTSPWAIVLINRADLPVTVEQRLFR